MFKIDAGQTFATESEQFSFGIHISGDIVHNTAPNEGETRLYMNIKQMQFLRDTLSTLIQQKPEVYKATCND